MISKLVYCRTRFISFHKWGDAPIEVAFLRNLHRHEFHVKVAVSVTHSDRDVEFITLKNDVDKIIQDLRCTWDEGQSCEMMAEAIYAKLPLYKVFSIDVSEDGENGALIVYG
jgi:6-pyruvoyl-tetrahydropterin synthase